MAGKHSTLSPYRGSLTRRLLCFFLPVSLIPLITVGILEYFNAKSALTNARQKQLAAVNLLITNELEHYYNDVLNNLFSHATEATSLITSIKSGWGHSGKSLQNYLTSYEYRNLLNTKKASLNQLMRFYDYTQLLIIDTTGHILFSKGHLPLSGSNIITNTHLSHTPLTAAVNKALLQEEWQYASTFNYTLSTENVSKTNFFIIPLLGKNEQRIGVMAIGLPAARDTQKIMRQSRELGPHVISYLVDEQQNIRFTSGTEKSTHSSKENRAVITHGIIKTWLKGNIKQVSQVTEYHNHQNEPMLGVAQSLSIAGIPMLLITEVPSHEAFATITQFRNYVFLLIALIIAAVTLLSLFLVIHITRPIKKVTQWANQVAEGNYVYVAPLPYNDEIGKLSQSFAIMTKRLRIMDKDNTEQTWLQNGLIELNNVLRGGQHLPDLSQKVTDWLCSYTQIDSVELWFHPTDNFSSQQPLAITQTHPTSITGSSQSKRIYKLPLLFRGKTTGQLVLKPKKPLTLLQQSFLELVVEPITFSLCSIQLSQQLKQASQYKSEFLANMSHELRTPLHSILTLSQILEENCTGNLSKEQQASATTMHQVGQGLLHTINDILDLSKVEAGKLDIEKTSFSINALLKMLEIQFSVLTQKKNIQFSVVNNTEQQTIYTDKHRLLQILQNLLGNAFKFTEQGSIELKVTSSTSETCSFTVSDTGIGIPTEKQTTVFQAFHQADSSDSRNYGGTGLGLSVSHQLSHLLGGCITLQSQAGEGASFTLFLPVKEAESEIVGNANTTPPSLRNKRNTPAYKSGLITETPVSSSVSKQVNGLCLLIIGQDLRQAFYLSRLLEPLGIYVKLANTRHLVEKKLADSPAVHVALIEEQSIGILDLIANSPQCKHSAVILLSKNTRPNSTKVLSAYAGDTLKVPCTLQTLLESISMHAQAGPIVKRIMDDNNDF